MAEVAKKLRFFFIWEQDSTYQSYIRPNWGKYNITTIVSDQFEAIAYRWKQIQPEEMQVYFDAAWMKKNILENHGPLCSLYEAHKKDSERNNHEYYAGDFRSEGDSPAFLHTIVTGLRNMESPDWGGWGGRYVRVYENTWLDPVPVEGIPIRRDAGIQETHGAERALGSIRPPPPALSTVSILNPCGVGRLRCKTILPHGLTGV